MDQYSPPNVSMRRFSRQQGFSLLELSIVVTIIAVVAAASIAYTNSSLKSKQTQATVKRMEAIEEALINYRRAFNRLPCPADVLKTVDSAVAPVFGVEVGTAGDGNCTGANWSVTVGSKNVSGGMVPIKTLRLPDSYAFDGWGRKIEYHVDRQFTLTNAFTDVANPVSDINDMTTGAMTVNDQNGQLRTNRAAYVILSHGYNGHGAYGRDATTRRSAGSTNTHEFENCDCESGYPYDDIFVQRLDAVVGGSTTNIFDDVVFYATRDQLRSTSE